MLDRQRDLVAQELTNIISLVSDFQIGDQGALDDSRALVSLGLDSLGLMEVITVVEDSHSIDVTGELRDDASLETFGDLLDLVMESMRDSMADAGT